MRALPIFLMRSERAPLTFEAVAGVVLSVTVAEIRQCRTPEDLAALASAKCDAATESLKQHLDEALPVALLKLSQEEGPERRPLSRGSDV